MYGPEGDVSRDNSRENKTNQFPKGPYIKCFVIYMYLGFPLNNHIAKTSKQRRRIAQLYTGRDTFEFDQRHVAKNQPQCSFC